MALTNEAAEPASPAHDAGSQEEHPRPSNRTTSESLLEDLATRIQENAGRISSFLRGNGHSLPSFDVDAPTATLPASAPTEIHAARQALMEAALQTFQLAAGPSEYLPHLAVGVRISLFLLWDDRRLLNMLPYSLTVVSICHLFAMVNPFWNLRSGSPHR